MRPSVGAAVLTARAPQVREALFEGPLTPKDRDWLGYIERELLARPSSAP